MSQIQHANILSQNQQGYKSEKMDRNQLIITDFHTTISALDR
jgi:hypothetical protein